MLHLLDLQVLCWLKLKLRRLKESLPGLGSSFQQLDNAALSQYAAGLLSEYLTTTWHTRLLEACNLPRAGETRARRDLPASKVLLHMEKQRCLVSCNLCKICFKIDAM